MKAETVTTAAKATIGKSKGVVLNLKSPREFASAQTKTPKVTETAKRTTLLNSKKSCVIGKKNIGSKNAVANKRYLRTRFSSRIIDSYHFAEKQDFCQLQKSRSKSRSVRCEAGY